MERIFHITASTAGVPTAARCSACGSCWDAGVLPAALIEDDQIIARRVRWEATHLCVEPAPPPVAKVRKVYPPRKNNPPSTPHRYHKDPDDPLDASLETSKVEE